MGNPAKLLKTLIAFCGLAFVGFVIASFLDPAERGTLQASAIAFIVGTALAVASLGSHRQLSRRLDSLERRTTSPD